MNAERVFIRHALRASFTIDEIFNFTKIDRWLLVQIKEIVDFEEELAWKHSCPSVKSPSLIEATQTCVHRQRRAHLDTTTILLR